MDAVVADVLGHENPSVRQPDGQLLGSLGIGDWLKAEPDAVDDLMPGAHDVVDRPRTDWPGVVMARRVPIPALDADITAAVNQVLHRGQGVARGVDAGSTREMVGMRMGDVEPGDRLSQAGVGPERRSQ